MWLGDDAVPPMTLVENATCTESLEEAKGPRIICFDSLSCNVFCCAKRGVIKKVMKCCGQGRQDCQSLCR